MLIGPEGFTGIAYVHTVRGQRTEGQELAAFNQFK